MSKKGQIIPKIHCDDNLITRKDWMRTEDKPKGKAHSDSCRLLDWRTLLWPAEWDKTPTLSYVIRPFEISPQRFSLLTLKSPLPHLLPAVHQWQRPLKDNREQHNNRSLIRTGWRRITHSQTNTLLTAETGIKNVKSAVKIYMDSIAHKRLVIKSFKHNIYSIP